MKAPLALEDHIVWDNPFRWGVCLGQTNCERSPLQVLVTAAVREDETGRGILIKYRRES